MLHRSTASPATAVAGPDRLAANPDVLFVYGTLQFPEVLEALLGLIPDSVPATARGWRAAALANRVYPGLVAADDTATGLLLTDLSPEEWRVLDTFEDDWYDLRRLHLASGGHGWAYVWPGDEVLPGNWDAEAFRSRHLSAYAARCARITTRDDARVS
ncbi:gamma-glutamylcyclotransferase family protein [Streptomyces jumonjinensis]|uniref:Putative gamma-glutamylcyclotransferase n=1 Tax=Streptomyces jumonjinensis TaxID=1945 RepID=A0A646KUV3_STRJU|nr:gamma-glutamylcyclotransferase family protein [Streptomyces jumonjinensis]MQT04776.1 gamma-glutamylcyclotransferase [Streptomyces jumonjinensis]